MDAIETTFTITQSEYVRAMRRHNKTRIQFFRDVIASALIILAGICLLPFAQTRLWGGLLILPGVALLSMIAYIKLVVPISIYQAAKRKLSSEYRMQFRNDGLRFSYSDIDSSLKWSIFSSWLRDNEFYILYHDGVGCSVIPRRAFQGGDDEKFSRLLMTVLGPPTKS